MTPEAALPPARRGSRRLILVIVALLAIGGTATALVWNYAYPSHRPGAVVVFHIGRTTPMLLPSRGEVVRDDFEEFREAQAALVRSRRVLNNAINHFEVRTTELIRVADPDPVSWLEANLRVTSNPGSSFLRVELDSENTKEALIVLDAVAKSYLAATIERDNGVRVGRLSALEKASEQHRQELNHHRARIEQYSRLTYTGRSLIHIRSEAELVQDVRVAKDELRRVRLDRVLFEASPPPHVEDLLLQSRIAVGGGAVLVTIEKSDTAQRRIGSHAEKALAAREQFWINEVKFAEETLVRYSENWRELERFRSEFEVNSQLVKQLADEIERCKLDLGSAPRVTMADEPFVRSRER